MPGLAHQPDQLDDVGARVALVEVEEHRVARATPRPRPRRRSRARGAPAASSRWRRRCSTFAVKSKRHVRELGVERPRHGERVARAVEEVGVAERHVGRPGLDALADVGQDHVRRHHEEAPAVDRRDRAVPAEVLAAAARLDVPHQLVPPVALEPRVLLEGGERRAARHRKAQPLEVRRRGARGRPHPRRELARPRLERLGERHERRLRLAADHGVDAVGEQVLGVQLRVEPVGRDVARGVHRADALDQRDAEPERGVHRHGDGDEPGARHLVGVERLDGDVHDGRRVAARLEERRRPRDGERLVAQLVARDQEDRPGLPHPAPTLPSRGDAILDAFPSPPAAPHPGGAGARTPPSSGRVRRGREPARSNLTSMTTPWHDGRQPRPGGRSRPSVGADGPADL